MSLKQIFKCRWLVNSVLFAYEILNIFMADVIIFEATEGVSFDWESLISNKFFLIWVAIVSVYNLVSRKMIRDNEKLEVAYEETEIALLNFITKDTGNHDYFSVNETVKVLEKIKKIKDNKDG